MLYRLIEISIGKTKLHENSLLSIVDKLHAKVLIGKVMKDTNIKYGMCKRNLEEDGCKDQVFSLKSMAEMCLAKNLLRYKWIVDYGRHCQRMG